MLYALRKLIAFVFLGGLFWFIYQDLGNLDKPWFMHALTVLVIVFACFWLAVPMLVVRLRIHRRQVQNAVGFQKWRAEQGAGGLKAYPRRNAKLALEAGEEVYFHEKGTLYVPENCGFDAVSVRGAPGDVAFPGQRKIRRKIQRTHGYFTNRRIRFAGKVLDCAIPFSDIRAVQTTPGGLVFRALIDGREVRLAFTCQNPLVAKAVLDDLRRIGQ